MSVDIYNLTYPLANIRDFTLDDNLSPSGFLPENGPAYKLPKTNLGALDVFLLEFYSPA